MEQRKLSVQIEEAGYDDKEGAVRGIRFEVRPGELVGLIGPNGAGKSTTIKAMLGLLKRMRGEVRYPKDTPHYAYVPEQPIYYDDLTLWEHIELAGAAFGIQPDELMTRAQLLLERFRLTGEKHSLPSSFSKGMQQKMMLVLAFLHSPDVYIVDEPFIGLDPHATNTLLAMLDEERARGACVLMSTHVLDTAERICDSFVLIADGRLVAAGGLDDIRAGCGLPRGTLFDCFLTLLREEA